MFALISSRSGSQSAMLLRWVYRAIMALLFIFFFLRKLFLTFHVNRLPSRGFTWNFKAYFLRKIFFLECRLLQILLGALRVNIYILNVIVHDEAAILVTGHFSMQNIELSHDLWQCIRVRLCECLPVMFFVYICWRDVCHVSSWRYAQGICHPPVPRPPFREI